MQRKARSRSDAPGLVVAFGTAFTIFGTIGGSDCIAIGNGCSVGIATAGITIGAGVGIRASIVGGAGCTSSSHRATR